MSLKDRLENETLQHVLAVVLSVLLFAGFIGLHLGYRWAAKKIFGVENP